ncbi:MAG: MFS transporter [Verrucomicrobia bacterium]|nr:MFS transporter [Verrucomicrobiota bacterium]
MHTPRDSLSTQLKSLPRSAWILFAGTFINRFGSFVIPFLALYMTRQGFTTGQAGMAIAAYGVGHLIASFLGGHLADTFGRRKTIVLSMFSTAGTMMLLSQAQSLEALVGITFLVGLSAEIYRPASSALLADMIPAGQRVVAFSAYRWALNAGWALGPATAGFLMERSFFWLFVGNAVTATIYGVIALKALPRGVFVTSASGGWGATFRAIGRDARFMKMLAASLVVAIIFMQMTSTFSLEITRQGYAPSVYGMLISLNGLLVIVFELPLITFTQRFAARSVIAYGYLLIGVGFALTGVSQSIVAFSFVVVVFTIGEMISFPVLSAYVADLAPPEFRGRYMGAFGLSWAVALIGGPAAGLLLFGKHPIFLWTACGFMGVIAAVIVLSLPRPVRQ